MTTLQEANTLFQRRRYFDALMLARAALIAATDDEAAWLQVGIDSLLSLALPEQAESLFVRQANRLLELGQQDAAVATYRRALMYAPNSPTLQLQAGLCFANAKLPIDAEHCYRSAIRLDSCNASAHNNLGNLLKEQDRLDAAFTHYQRAIAINPLHAEAHSNLGNWYKQDKQPRKAEQHYLRSLALKPAFIEGLNNYGVFLQESGQHDAALVQFNKVLAINPDYAPVFLNMGNSLMNLRQLAQAEAVYRKALTLQPETAEFAFNLALCLLLQDKRAEGWTRYEARYSPTRKVRMTTPPAYPFPQWKGEDIQGKTLLVWQEQGLGDQVMFAWYLQALKARTGARLVVVCHAALRELFARIPGVDVAANDKDSIPWCHYWTYIMSLPFHLQQLQAPLPAFAPYLVPRADALAALQQVLAAASGYRVGLCWKGSTKYLLDHLRSPGLAPFTPLLALKTVRYVSLLPDSRAEFTAWAGNSAIDLGHELDANSGRFEETLALIDQVDLVITSDTSIAHLARALGKPMWLLLPYAGEWRWAVHPSNDYPGLRIFRQETAGDWAGVVGRLVTALKQEFAHVHA